MAVKIDADTLRKIEEMLSRGQRVELIPTKDGVKAIRVRRDLIK